MALELFEELNYLGSFDAAGVDVEVKAQQHQPADDRKTLPIESLLQQGCLPSQSPGPNPRRPCAQTALINKDYQPALASRFFFSSGHCTRFHWRIDRKSTRLNSS